MDQLVEFAGNHPFIILGVFAAWAAVMFYETRLRRLGTTHVSAADAVRLINAKGAMVIDVRKAEEFSAGHIVNARNVVLDRLHEGAEAIGKKKDKILLTVCDTGLSAGRAAGLLRKAGYENTFSIKGGLASWRAENLPLVK